MITPRLRLLRNKLYSINVLTGYWVVIKVYKMWLIFNLIKLVCFGTQAALCLLLLALIFCQTAHLSAHHRPHRWRFKLHSNYTASNHVHYWPNKQSTESSCTMMQTDCVLHLFDLVKSYSCALQVKMCKLQLVMVLVCCTSLMNVAKFPQCLSDVQDKLQPE